MADNKVTIEVAVEGNAKAAFKKLGDNTKDFEKTAKKSFLNLGRIFDNFIANVASNAASTAFRVLSRAASGLFNLFKEGVEAAKLQEDAIVAMNVALARSGEFSKEASKEIQDWASALQRTTIVGDETTLQLFALAKAFGFTKDQAKVATEAAIELSAAAGISLEEATRRVGRTISGSIEDVSKFASGIKDLTKDELAAGKAADLLVESLGGTAAAQTKTYSGAIKQLSNTFGDVKEVIGFLITNNKSMIAAFNQAGSVIEGLGKKVSDNQGAFSNLVTDGIAVVGKAIIIMVKGVRLATKWWLKLLDVIQKHETGLKSVAAFFTRAGSDARKAAQQANDAWKETRDQLKALEGDSTVFDTLEKGLKSVVKSAEDARGKTKDFGAGLKNMSKDAAETRKHLAALTEEANKIADSFIKAAEGPVGALDKQKKVIQEALDAQLEGKEKFEEALDEINAQRELKIEEQQLKEEELVLKEIQRRRDANTALATLNSDAAKKEIDDNKKRIALLMKDERLSLAAQAGLKKKDDDRDDARRKKKLADMSSSLNQIASLQSSKSKELRQIGKAAAISSTIISMHEGAQKAFSAFAGIPIVGPALGIAAAAAAITAGVARIAAISGTPLQQGITSVPAGFPNDTFSSRLSTGERVVNQAQNEDLTAFLASSRGSGETLRAILGVLMSQNQQVNVNIGGEQIIDAIQDQVDGGRQLAV